MVVKRRKDCGKTNRILKRLNENEFSCH
jgi:hypothetical protein